MRRVLAVVLSVLAVLAFVTPGAEAQAPTSKVTITGLVDNVTSYIRNLSQIDNNYSNRGSATRDTEWYARTRVRPDITGEVGTTKFVLGIEIDAAWGQTGAADTNVCTGTACPAQTVQRSGTTGGWDLNTDTIGQIEVKWAYTEFDMPGIPFATRVRLGAQPWAQTYKIAALAQGDFPGVHIVSTFTPELKMNLTYAQVEEESTGFRDGFFRGDDWAFIGSLEFTPVKGIDILPLFSVFSANGNTSGSARQGRGGLGTGQLAGVAVANNAAAPFNGQTQEIRYTMGVDARVRMGPFMFDPTILWQTGQRDIIDSFGPTVRKGNQDMNAWLIDIRGGFQTGPLLLEGAVIYTTGNTINSDVRRNGTTIRFYQPISTDSGYYTTWAEHWALGIDYFGMIRNSVGGISPGVAIGYDKYGLMRLGARASYAVTPAFTVRTAVTANWTDEPVDDRGFLTAATGITPCRQGVAGDARVINASGRACPAHADGSRYLGTEIDLGFQWRFAPGLALDVVGAYTFTGDALAAGTTANANTGAVFADPNPRDIQSVHVRLRYNF